MSTKKEKTVSETKDATSVHRLYCNKHKRPAYECVKADLDGTTCRLVPLTDVHQNK